VRRIGLVVVIAVCVAALGCGGSNDDDASERTTQEGRGKPSPAAKQRVPGSLSSVESGAEDAIDFAQAGDRRKVVATARALRRTADGRATRDLRRVGVGPEGIFELESRARLLAAVAPRADFARVSLAANRISALMPQFYARYQDPVPPAVLKLDYLDREAQLRSLAGDRASVGPAVDQLTQTWTTLRPRVLAAGGSKVATRYTRHVAAMGRLARGSHDQALQNEAARGLELVDALETRFRKRTGS
jgi:hypothetical protein